MFVFPLLAALVAAAFTAAAFDRGRRSDNPALRIWAFALLQFALASAALAWGIGLGWNAPTFRVYYIFGAVLSPAWLGLGTVWLLGSRRLALGATAGLALASAAATWIVATADMLPGASSALALREVVSGGDVFPEDVRTLSRVFSFAGLVVVAGGLVWSAARRRSKAFGLGLLLVGILVVSGVSVFARRGMLVPFSAGLAVGVSLMYAGFLRTR